MMVDARVYRSLATIDAEARDRTARVRKLVQQQRAAALADLRSVYSAWENEDAESIAVMEAVGRYLDLTA